MLAVWAVAAVRRVAVRLPARCAPCTSSSASALLLGIVSTARIFGRPWYYLTLWAWGATMLVLGAVVWSALRCGRTGARRSTCAARDRRRAGRRRGRRPSPPPSTFADADHPEERLSDAVGALAGPTYDARRRRGRRRHRASTARYIVRWSDAADIGSPGFGLLDELERRGLDVAADEYFRVQVTDHRTRPRADNDRPDPPRDRRLHRALAGRCRTPSRSPRTTPAPMPSGPSTPTVRERFIERLTAEGLDELVPIVDTNLFGISVDTRPQRRRPGRPVDADRDRPADGGVHRPAAGRRRRRRAVSDPWT